MEQLVERSAPDANEALEAVACKPWTAPVLTVSSIQDFTLASDENDRPDSDPAMNGS